MSERISRDLINRWAEQRKPVARIGSDHDAIVFPVSEFWRPFGLTREDIQAEVAAGRLILSGVDSGREPGISLAAFIRWTLNPNSPPELLAKARDMGQRNLVR